MDLVLCMSILENQLAPARQSSMFPNLIMKNLYLMVILLVALLSTDILQDLSFLEVRRARTAQGLMLWRPKPLDNSSWTYPFNYAHLLGFNLWWGRLGSCELGTKSIACCISWRRWSSLGSSPATLANSLSRSSISTVRSRNGGLLEGALRKAIESKASSLAKIVRKNLLEFPSLSKGL